MKTDPQLNSEVLSGIFENLYSSKLGNEKGIGALFDTHDPVKLNQEGIKNLNKSVTSNEIRAVIKKLQKESPGPDGFTAEFYHPLKKNSHQCFSNHSIKYKRKEYY
jgi:hypothetical protein